jgi:hypothetical protein
MALSLSVSDTLDVDLSRIEDRILQPNYLLMLGFPDGWVPLRILYADPLFYFVYDPIAEGAMTGPIPAAVSTNGITGLGWQDPIRFSSSYIPGRPDNVLRLGTSNIGQLIQTFIGISPKMLRLYRQVPMGTNVASLPSVPNAWSSTYNQMGWIDGRESPFSAPSPRSEMIIPPMLDVAFAMANPTPEPMNPLFLLVINRVSAGVIGDVDLIEKMLSRRVYVKYYNVGGLNQYTYDVKSYYGITPIQLNATKQDIANALKGAETKG